MVDMFKVKPKPEPPRWELGNHIGAVVLRGNGTEIAQGSLVTGDEVVVQGPESLQYMIVMMVSSNQAEAQNCDFAATLLFGRNRNGQQSWMGIDMRRIEALIDETQIIMNVDAIERVDFVP